MMRRIFVTFTLLVLCGRTEALRRIFPGPGQAPRPIFSGPRPAQLSIIAGPRRAQLSIIAAPLCAALSGCSLKCPNGLAKDANGCETCQCRICDKNPCAHLFGPGIFAACEHLRDKDGCEICDCKPDPCFIAGCQPWQICWITDDVAQCFDSDTRPPCPPIDCKEQCHYGGSHDLNFCPICKCYDPCERITCRVNEKCIACQPWRTSECQGYFQACVPKDTIVLPPDTLQIIPRTTQAPIGANNLRATMSQCCSKVGLSGSCLTTCVTDSGSFFLDYPSCLPGKKISEYLRCISASDFRDPRLGINQPNLWRLKKSSKTSKLKGEKAD